MRIIPFAMLVLIAVLGIVFAERGDARTTASENPIVGTSDEVIERSGETNGEIERTNATAAGNGRGEQRERAVQEGRKERELRQETMECREMQNDTEQALCNRRIVAERAHREVRERQRLSMECRNLTGQNRSSCEERVNRMFRDEIQDEFREWVRARRLNLTNISSESKDVRARIHRIHKEKKEELINKTKEAAKQRLINRLENVIDNAQKHSGLMERAIKKAAEKGHDTSRLEFVLEKYDITVDSAKLFFDDAAYRESLSALKEAKTLFKEFRKIFADIVSKQKRGEKHLEITMDGNETGVGW